MPISIITYDDIRSLLNVLRFKGIRFFMAKLKLRSQDRIKAQWDNYQSPGSDWWEIPRIRRRWNHKISGEETLSWEDYFYRKYIASRNNISMLSVGCGTGEKERIFAKFHQINYITGIDISEKTIKQAQKKAKESGLKIDYQQSDFTKIRFDNPFDVILFNSSLHHFNNIEQLIKQNIIPNLKDNGLLVIFEYTGSNRFQYTRQQIKEANRCLSLLPYMLRIRKDNTHKKKNYRPGVIRMWLNDPSEAPCSEDIMPSLRKLMTPIEEKPIGGAILHMLLKDIAHNFRDEDDLSTLWLERLFKEEDMFFKKTGQSDFWFGVYEKRVSV